MVDRGDGRSSVPQVTSGQYRVKRGDTLFSIASRNGWEWRALAAQNGLAAPYVIHVGQVIRFGNGGSASGSSRIIRRPATSPSTPLAPPPVTRWRLRYPFRRPSPPAPPPPPQW